MENASTGNLPDGNHWRLLLYIIIQPARCRVSEYKACCFRAPAARHGIKSYRCAPKTPGKDETTCRDHPTGRNHKTVSAAERQTFQSTYHPLSVPERGHAGRDVGARIRRLTCDRAAYTSHPFKYAPDPRRVLKLGKPHSKRELCDRRMVSVSKRGHFPSKTC